MTWDDWSDKEIGFAVTTLINDVNGWSLIEDGTVFYHCGIDGSGYFSIDVIDINNPADMWPIIIKHGICLTSPTKGRKSVNWSASWNEDGGKWSSGDIAFGDKNPLRAAAIVFLMIKGVKPDERI